jgi:hypothetical protein
MAFLRAPDSELLYSGDAIRKPWWAFRRSLSFTALAGMPSRASRSAS